MYCMAKTGIFQDFSHPKYWAVHKYLQDFQGWSRGGGGSTEGQTLQVSGPTLQVLDILTLGDTADVNPVIKFLPHTL
jgi:hypothetical protein